MIPHPVVCFPLDEVDYGTILYSTESRPPSEAPHPDFIAVWISIAHHLLQAQTSWHQVLKNIENTAILVLAFDGRIAPMATSMRNGIGVLP